MVKLINLAIAAIADVILMRFFAEQVPSLDRVAPKLNALVSWQPIQPREVWVRVGSRANCMPCVYMYFISWMMMLFCKSEKLTKCF